MKNNLVRGTIALVLALSGSFAFAQANSSSRRVSELSNRFVAQSLAHDPTLAELTGLPFQDHSRFVDLAPQAITGFADQEATDLRDLRAIQPDNLPESARAVYATLQEQLESDLQMRVCKTELWDVNHFDGWQSNFAQVAEMQPITTQPQRAQALARWSSMPTYLAADIANLRRGEQQGYSAPQSVVRRVIAQMDGLVAGAPEQSPFYSPAARSSDAAFRHAFRQVIVDKIDPAIRTYRDYLQQEYLPKARIGVAISDLPQGPPCYQAFLRANTTLQRTPQQVYALGQQTVAAHEAEVRRLGQQMFGTTDIPTILAHVKSSPDDHFHSQAELLAYSRKFLARAQSMTAAKLIEHMPRQGVVIEPEQPFEEQAGVSSHYIDNAVASQTSTYRIELGNWATETRAEAEITTVHETWPGHHLQEAVARELLPNSPLTLLINNSAYAEGWARYAESMSEDAGIYQTKAALIFRRIWPAHGMVVDPGLHAMHWTREQAIAYLISTGKYTRKSADDDVDRIAVMPGQLTSYDSGGLEIFALRQEAESRLGSRFRLKAFNMAVLDEGGVPLMELRRHVEEWIAGQLKAPPAE